MPADLESLSQIYHVNQAGLVSLPSKPQIVALGISEEIPHGLSPEDTVELIRIQGGIAIAAHPFVSYREGLFTQVKFVDVDAMETLNSRYIFGYSNWRAKNLAKEKNIPQIGASDAHFLGAIGSCVTEREADFTVEASFRVSSLEAQLYSEPEGTLPQMLYGTFF